MPEFIEQQNVDALVNQMQEGNEALSSQAQAVDQAAALASEIASEIQSADPPAQVPAESQPQGAPVAPPELRRLLAIEVPVIVQLGVRRLNVGEVMRFAVGAIIEFSKSADEELELLANNKPIGRGHAVKVGENFGIKLTGISPVKETIRKLGGA